MKALTLLVAAFSSSIMSVKRHTSLRLWVVSPTLFVCRNQSNCRHQGSSPSGWLCSPPCMFFQTGITSNYWNLAPLFLWVAVLSSLSFRKTQTQIIDTKSMFVFGGGVPVVRSPVRFVQRYKVSVQTNFHTVTSFSVTETLRMLDGQ